MHLSQRQDSRRRSYEIQKKDDDIKRLTRERDEEREIRINKEKEIERLQSLLKEQNLHAVSSLESRKQDATRKVTHIFYLKFVKDVL